MRERTRVRRFDERVARETEEGINEAFTEIAAKLQPVVEANRVSAEPLHAFFDRSSGLVNDAAVRAQIIELATTEDLTRYGELGLSETFVDMEDTYKKIMSTIQTSDGEPTALFESLDSSPAPSGLAVAIAIHKAGFVGHEITDQFAANFNHVTDTDLRTHATIFGTPYEVTLTYRYCQGDTIVALSSQIITEDVKAQTEPKPAEAPAPKNTPSVESKTTARQYQRTRFDRDLGSADDPDHTDIIDGSGRKRRTHKPLD